MKPFKGNVHTIEPFGTFDGPGIRYVLFLQGCPFQCKFCHNRDSWSTHENTLISVSDILNDYANYEPFYKKGGLTLSGGEPLMQAEFVKTLFKKAHEKNIHTTLDTSAACFSLKNAPLIEEVLDYTDLVLLDIKHIDPLAHKALTNATNTRVLQFLDVLEKRQQKTIIRHVLIPTINDDTESIQRFKEYIKHYRAIEKVEVLPYHSHGKYKWEALGLSYPLDGIEDMDKTTAKKVEIMLNDALYKNRIAHPNSTFFQEKR